MGCGCWAGGCVFRGEDLACVVDIEGLWEVGGQGGERRVVGIEVVVQDGYRSVGGGEYGVVGKACEKSL